MNKVSITKWETLLQANTIKVEVNGLDGVEMTIKTTLSLREMMQFVEDVVSSCVDHANGTFTPEARGFAIKYALVTTYANFNTPTDISKLYDLLYRTDVVPQILGYIDREQFNEILIAIDKRIEHGMRILESQAAIEVNNVVERMNILAGQFESAFDGVDVGMINQTMENIHAISNMSEERVTRAVLDMQKERAEDATKNNNIVVLPKIEK